MARVQLVLACVASIGLAGACRAGRTDGVAERPAADASLPELQRSIDGYMQVRQTVQREVGAATANPNPASMAATEKEFANRLRAARKDARQGDIFTPAVAIELRRRLNPEVRGSGAADTRAVIRDDGPAAFALKVNSEYPAGASFPTMPPNVLAVLPALPKELEYRIVERHLILRDVGANLIVDYLFDVMCQAC